MPTLDWIGKKAVVNHHREVPYRLIHCNKDKSHGDPDAGNLLVQGDNLEALKALLPYYAGKVKCIYIDPPYNTGNESWVYNDNVNSPEIRAWLGSVVGKEAEDLSRHDKWLCMMYPRLRLLKEFLTEDGVIFVSMDDSEAGSLRMLLDDVFGRGNFLASIIWQKVFSPKNSAQFFSDDHDYIYAYAKNIGLCQLGLLARGAEQDARYTNPDNDPRGPWTSGDFSARNFYGEGTYAVETPSGRIIPGPPTGMYWRVSKQKMKDLDTDGRIWWGETKDNVPRLKRFLSEVKQGVVPQTLWFYKDVGHTQEAKKELLETVDFADSGSVFITPKPTRLMKRIIEIASEPGDIIMDSFAGSGTTGVAVAREGGGRRFILIEMLPSIAEPVTAERLRRVMSGYEKNKLGGKTETVEGTGGGFRFCTLGEPLFDADGNVSPAVTYPDLAAHVFFCETGSPIPKRADGASPLIGTFQNRAIYLLHSAEAVGVAREQAGNVLTGAILEALPLPAADFAGARIVYAEGCTVPDDRLSALGVTFKQIPYQIEGI
ncbi:site-specific DNA-methyltransferase (adenine-specific)/adenine-specific DNA-methyltransferase [Rhizobium sp. BK316]|uniref:site-specific DNA-methyltransferase n=1 Tax=Rhizobium sp. BK316 TaxID=2587053 RepID=UPI001607BF98|nr:site-specific DNA-methyltransferase [Rhizobium sp. BK316]MBB3408021.1 site-specific DNA-methyltransferase (adenine-specific)/adenine-specific DNA-methyltransferase [Rhizobium sp. BK316]